MRLATIIGTIQSTLTYFPNLRPEWKQNCEEERLLGVSLTGIYDNPLMYKNTPELESLLGGLNEVVRQTNLEWAAMLGINPSMARTCVKPSGTVSCLVDASSGIHPRYADYYFRRVRIDKKDPLYKLMRDEGVPVEDCVLNPHSTAVFTFAMKAPDNAKTGFDISAIDHLNLWLTYKRYWCDHNPSATISYTEEEFLEVGAWVYRHFDEICGLSFLPKTEHVYEQAPFERISKAQYEDFASPDVSWDRLPEYEKDDQTKGAQELACTGGACEAVDLT